MKSMLPTLKRGLLLPLAFWIVAAGGRAVAADVTQLIADGRAALVARNIVAANASFRQAVAAAPSNEEANVLYAITEVVVLETTPQAQTLLNEMGVTSAGRDVFDFTARIPRGAFPPAGTTLTSDTFKTVATGTVLPVLIAANKNLEQVTDSTFTTTLSAQETNMRTVIIDYGDIQVLRALLEAAITTIDLDNSYNTLVGFSTLDAWYKSNALSLQHILSVYPSLLTFTNRPLVATALSAFNVSVDDYVAGSAFIRSRTSNTDRLFVIDPDKAAEEASYRLHLLQFQASLATSVNFDYETTVYLGALERMTLPLRSYVPAFDGNYIINGTYPDPTFNGGLIAIAPSRYESAALRLGEKLDKHFHYSNSSTTVTISSPKANAQIATASPSVTVTGHAKSRAPLDHVEVSLNSDDDSAFQLAKGASKWSIKMTNAQPGGNTIYARAIDKAGNVSVEQTRTFNYIVTKSLAVSVQPAGGGIVSPGFFPSSLRRVGTTYTIAAIPAAGYLFQSWSNPEGSQVYSDEASYTFAMTAKLSLRANFIANPYPSLAGRYAGQVTGASSKVVGFTSFVVTPAGAFTGKLVYGGATYSLSGKLDSFGRISLAVPVGKNSFIQLSGGFADLADASQGMRVDVHAPGSTGVAQANYSPKTTALSGKYTMLLEPAKSETGSPQGNGYGTVTIAPDGTVSFEGVLADGTPLAYSTTLTGSQSWTTYVPLYGGKGSFSGEMDVHIPPAPDGIDGTAVWIKPLAPADTIFRKGFTASLTAIGSVYTEPAANTRVLPFSNTAPNSEIATGGGNLAAEIEHPATLGRDNKLTLLNPGADKMQLTINLSTGVFTGSFFDIDASATRLFGGVVLQTEDVGSGFFLGNGQSGVLSLTPQ
jgi:hypothetical protein